jgi:hypothetical protein
VSKGTGGIVEALKTKQATYPEDSRSVFIKCKQRIMCYARSIIRVVLIGYEIVPIVSVKTTPGSEPQIADSVLENAGHMSWGALIDRESFESGSGVLGVNVR